MKYRLVKREQPGYHTIYIIQKKFIWWSDYGEYNAEYDTCFRCSYDSLEEANHKLKQLTGKPVDTIIEE